MQQYSGKRTAKIALVFFVLAAAAILADWLTALVSAKRCTAISCI